MVAAARRMQAAWGSVMVESRVVALGGGGSLGAVANGAVFTERVTIARIRGHGYIHLDAGAALDAYVMAVGLIIVKEEAFTVGGVGSMPIPFTDINQSWLWHGLFPLGPAVTATDDGGDMSRNVRFEIDSKAQRKVQAGDALAFVWEGRVSAGTPTADAFAATRHMALLP